MIRSFEDTIAAISTPPGEGGIGIVRISGGEAITIAAQLFASSTGRDIRAGRGRVFHGHVRDNQGVLLDEVLLQVMRAPHTYTRQDVVEINCHGGAGPLAAVLEQTIAHGARLAEPGEFTQRAFLNGRIDLVQAEAVIDRIRARTQASLRAASAAASGTLSKEIHAIKTVLADALAHVEAAVDFPEEDLPGLVNDALQERLINARDRMAALLETAKIGRLYREGATIAIAGRPNVGKSSLFNALLRDARAIVSSQPGTTRDRIEETITLSGIPARLVDTAGLRATQDEVEQMGVDVARDAVQRADLVLFVLDTSEPFTKEDTHLAHDLDKLEVPVWVVMNKIDLAPEAATKSSVGGELFPANEVEAPGWIQGFAGSSPVSAKTGQGLAQLEAGLAQLLLGATPIAPDHCLITRAHQQDSLRRARTALTQLLDHYDASPEFLSMDLRDALNRSSRLKSHVSSFVSER